MERMVMVARMGMRKLIMTTMIIKVGLAMMKILRMKVARAIIS